MKQMLNCLGEIVSTVDGSKRTRFTNMKTSSRWLGMVEESSWCGLALTGPIGPGPAAIMEGKMDSHAYQNILQGNVKAAVC